jgi:hypothetical protein
MGYQYITSERLAQDWKFGKNLKEVEFLYTIEGNTKQYSQFRKLFDNFL